MRWSLTTAILVVAAAMPSGLSDSSYSETITSSEWRLFAATEESHIELAVPRAGGTATILQATYRTDGSYESAWWSTSSDGAGVSLWSQETGPIALDAYSPATTDVDVFRTFPRAVGQYYILIVAWGDTPWREIRGTSVTLIGGGAAPYLRGEDMEGGWYAGGQVRSAYLTAPVAKVGTALGGGVHASSARSYEFDVEHVLIGVFGNPMSFDGVPLQVGNYTLTGPTGTETCICYLADASGPNSGDPGHYAIHDDTTGITTNADPDAFWVDVPFPFLAGGT